MRERALDRFVTLLALDRSRYEEKLDFFEVHFDQALKRLRQDAERAVDREASLTSSVEDDEGKIPETVERAAGAFNPLDPATLEVTGYRLRLPEAINSLPADQQRIVHMLQLGFLIDSNDPEEVTIAKVLGKSDKTIRLHRDRAFCTIRSFLAEEPNK